MRGLCAILAIFLGTQAIAAEPKNKAGAFDYYVLALTWSPNWCAIEGDARSAEQCDGPDRYGWALHGLWPQYERGWPANCATIEQAPSRRMTRDMTDIMGSDGLAWHQWKKHGTCSGLSGAGYFDLARRAYESITRPNVFRKLDEPVKLAPKVIEAAFMRDNPLIKPDMITITCRENYITEARICLTKDLEPRTCGTDVIKDCTRPGLFEPMR